MITVRPAAERGTTKIGWLNAKHSFSFGQYYDPRHMGFRSLRVINDDTVSPGSGFGRHGHRDMEIITWVLSGSLAHEDSTGGRSTLHAGDVQRMSAGKGVMHSEFNASSTEPLHLLQIWIEPNEFGIPPRHEDLRIPPAEIQSRLRVVASPTGENGSSPIAADAKVFVSKLAAGDTIRYELAAGRHAWVQVGAGAVAVNGKPLVTGDGAAISEETAVTLTATAETDLLLFDLA